MIQGLCSVRTIRAFEDQVGIPPDIIDFFNFKRWFHGVERVSKVAQVLNPVREIRVCSDGFKLSGMSQRNPSFGRLGLDS